MTSPLLEVKGLDKHFPVVRGVFGRVVGQVRAVDGVDFEIAEGETLGLVGESGCGKSTVGRTVLRLLEPTAGRIAFEGRDITELESDDLRQLRRNLQIIFQDPMSSLNPRMRVVDIVSEALVEHGLARGAEARERGIALLNKVGVPRAWVNRYPHEFSGGQRQRIGIARALALSPKLIVCDEAVSALDVSIRAQVINLLIQLREELGLAYLFISHDLSVVRHISHRVLVMYLGQVVEVAATEDLFATPGHPYTQALLSAVPVPDPKHRGRRVRLHGDVPTPLNPPSGCRFHTRCPARLQRCEREEPPQYLVGNQQRVKCFHAEGLEAEANWHQLLMARILEAEAAPTVLAPQIVTGERRGAAKRLGLQAPLMLLQVIVIFACLFGLPRVARRHSIERAKATISALADEVRGYQRNTGAYPKALGELGFRLYFVFDDGQNRDPWGHPFQYRTGADSGAPNFALTSLGPDGFPSADDILVAD
jgi:peptide/nickel transport system ATP-binding protein